jgi:hypothetical protein
MMSSRTITLFTERSDFSQQPTALVASILIHGVAVAIVSFGILYTPRLDTRAIAERYTVRRLDLETPAEQMRRSAGSKVNYPGPQPIAQTDPPGGKPAAADPPVLRQIAHAEKGPQTLLQPDIPSHLTLTQETPVPTLLMWSPQKTPVKNIVAPLPEKPTAADVTPSADAPNKEVNLADLNITATNLSAPKLPVLPSTTSPIAVHDPQREQSAPATVSQPSAQPTPAAVMSLSDLRMAKGTVTLPPVNESAATTSPGALTPRQAHDSSGPGNGNPARKSAGTGTEKESGNAANSPGPTGANGKPESAKLGMSQESEAGSGAGNQPSASQITLPKNGQFGAVVVGASLEDQFPEMAGVWSGRLAYTVYLHVGLARSWVLQYSVPRSDDAAAGGTIARLEAPWPYNIVRPNLATDAVDADALMIHGFVNQAGRFETLKIVFPPDFTQAQFVLNSLAQWQFRPAMQNGQPARVEVLLIIPEDLR